jgi:hypothetical protein
MNQMSRRRIRALLVVVLSAVGLSFVAAPAAAAPPEHRTAVVVQLVPGADTAAQSQRAAGLGGSVSPPSPGCTGPP